MAQRYRTAAALRKACGEYFRLCDQEGALYGEAGLALHLGVKLGTIRDWYDGKSCPNLREEIQRAYLRIQAQLESDPAYIGKGMVTKAIFLMKQPRLGGYQERREPRRDVTVHVKMGDGMDESDFE